MCKWSLPWMWDHRGMVRCGELWCGVVGYGKVWRAVVRCDGVWWGMVRYGDLRGAWWDTQLTCCCGSRRCGGRSCGHSRRAGSRRHWSPSSRAGSGHSGALPRRACRDSRRCWGHRRCGDPGGARPIPRGGRSKLQGRNTERTEHLWVHNPCTTKVQEMPAKSPLCLGTPLGFLGFFIPYPYKSELSLPLESVEF